MSEDALREEVRRRSTEINGLVATGEYDNALRSAYELRNLLESDRERVQTFAADLRSARELIQRLETRNPGTTQGPRTGSKPPLPVLAGSMVLLVVIAVVAWLGIGVWKNQQQKARLDRLQAIEAKASEYYETYRKNAQPVVDALSRIDASTETGVNVGRYSELVADANFQVNKLQETYRGKVPEGYPSYSALGTAMSSYALGLTAWNAKIRAESYEEYTYEQTLQTSWQTASAALDRAKESLASGDEWKQHYKETLRDAAGREDADFAVAAKAEAERETGK